ncbi:MAG: peptidylprolyl isomerase [Phototrophicaceae bacterium]
MKRTVLIDLAILVLVMFLIVACGGTVAPTPAPILEASPVATTAPTVGENVALVNGVPISVAYFEEVLARQQNGLAVADVTALQDKVLNDLITQSLIEQQAQQRGISVSDEMLDAEIATLQALVGDDPTAWQAWLDQNLYTEASFREELRAQLIITQMRDLVVGEVASDTTQVHARHILVSTKEQADEVLVRLDNGEDFVELARLYSLDVTTREEGGDLGWFTELELLEPLVAQTAFSLEVGQISPPIATRLGYHIIQTLEFDTLPLTADKQEEVAKAIFTEWINTLNDSAVIERYR